jgi:hypothetical protein
VKDAGEETENGKNGTTLGNWKMRRSGRVQVAKGKRIGQKIHEEVKFYKFNSSPSLPDVRRSSSQTQLHGVTAVAAGCLRALGVSSASTLPRLVAMLPKLPHEVQ